MRKWWEAVLERDGVLCCVNRQLACLPRKSPEAACPYYCSSTTYLYFCAIQESDMWGVNYRAVRPGEISFTTTQAYPGNSTAPGRKLRSQRHCCVWGLVFFLIIGVVEYEHYFSGFGKLNKLGELVMANERGLLKMCSRLSVICVTMTYPKLSETPETHVLSHRAFTAGHQGVEN